MISKNKTESGFSDFVNGVSSSNSTSNQENVKQGKTDNCETKSLKRYETIKVSKEGKIVPNGVTGSLTGISEQFIEFSDGSSGRLFYNTKNWGISFDLGGQTQYYDSKSDALRALFVYKKCGKVISLGKK